jgi:hypothetical protein
MKYLQIAVLLTSTLGFVLTKKSVCSWAYCSSYCQGDGEWNPERPPMFEQRNGESVELPFERPDAEDPNELIQSTAVTTTTIYPPVSTTTPVPITIGGQGNGPGEDELDCISKCLYECPQ